MKLWKRSMNRAVCLLIAGGLSGSPGALIAVPGAATPVRVALGQGSTLWLEGTSTMHDFESRTSAVSLSFTRDPAAAEPADPAAFEALVRDSAITGLDVEIPVDSLHSGKSGLDKNLEKALRAAQNPAIRFHLSHYAWKPAGASPDSFEIEAKGTLNVAGKDQPVTLAAHARRVASGLWVDGTQELLMTSFDVQPPKLMFGALKVGDRITVHYRLLLSPVTTGAIASPGRSQ